MKLIVDMRTLNDTLYAEAKARVVARYDSEVSAEDEKVREKTLMRGANVERIPEFIREELRNGTNYITIIKVVRENTGWGLKDSKDICDYIRRMAGYEPIAGGN